MARTSAQQRMAAQGWPRPWLLGLLLLLAPLPDVVQSKYANGARRTGKKLSGPLALEERYVGSQIQCLNLCDGVASCNALNFGAVTSAVNCQLFEERACQGHPLVVDPAVDYYDVSDQPAVESTLFYWDDPICAQDGYCSTHCSVEVVGDFCVADQHCSSPTLTPPGAYLCSNRTCQLSGDFWEVRPGFALPRTMDWMLYPFITTYKKLQSGTCALDISLKLGVGAEMEFGAASTDKNYQTRLMFRIGISSTDLYYYDQSGSKYPIVTGANTAGMVSAESYSRLKVSWCSGKMAIGPDENPTLVTGQANITQLIEYVMATNSGPESWLRVDSAVADPWLFDEAGTGPDPVFEFRKSMVSRRIAPSVDVTVKYDCKTRSYCHVYLRSSVYPEMLAIWIGAWANSKSALTYDDGETGPYLKQSATGPVLSETEFNTFTVRYNNGSVTVFWNDGTEPIYAVTAPRLLPPITSIGIGSSEYGSRKWIRAARYDPGWRTDTWRTHGTGFSNMGSEVYSP